LLALDDGKPILVVLNWCSISVQLVLDLLYFFNIFSCKVWRNEISCNGLGSAWCTVSHTIVQRNKITPVFAIWSPHFYVFPFKSCAVDLLFN
jgi:hypothetical protein